MQRISILKKMPNKLSNTTNKKLSVLLENTGDMALKRRARRIVEEIDPQPGEKILEIGCGDGFYLHLLSSLGIKNIKLTGTDIDKNALHSAKKNLKGKKIKLIQNDLLKGLPFEDDSFDKIIMSEVCEHLTDDVKGLKEAKRVLKKEGVLVITVPNANYPMFWDPVNWWLEHLFHTHIKEGFWAGIWSQHLRLYTRQEIENVVKKAGFNILLIKPLTYWCIPFNHNLMYFAARKLHSGVMPEAEADSVNKFKAGSKSRPVIIKIAFYIFNLIDKLNDLWIPKNKGVGLLIYSINE